MVAAGASADPRRLRTFLDDEAARTGFDVVGVARPDAVPEAGERLRRFVALGHHGTMGWMADTADRRADPRALWPGAKSVIMLGMNYGPRDDPRPALAWSDRGVVSVYARNRDYHDVVKGRLKEIAGRLAARTGRDVKVFVDTAPLMEKPFAGAAGLGWQGKHTNLVSRTHGSWLFLGAILSAAEIEADRPETDHCGSCRECLDVCPTDAFPAPYRLDARRCISYLTIEHKGPIPHEFRPAIGNRIYGCDDCLAVCPWNKFAHEASEAKLRARDDLAAPPLADLLALDDAAFRVRFSGSPVKRIGRDRFVRNVAIAAGNSGSPALASSLRPLLRDASPLVRGAVVWALGRLIDADALRAVHGEDIAAEADDDVRAEWRAALGEEVAA